MKKIILCAAALLFGTMAFAQVSGAPEAQVVAPLPGTGGHMNAGQSIQNGDDNAVRVRQAGTENSVYTEQDNGSGGGGNLARIMQTGDVQAGISAYRNAAEVLQSGDDNQSTTVQEGDLNNAYTAQGQNDDSSARNKARIQQGIGQQAEENHAAIEQDGNDNNASTLQIYDNSDAWTRQIGDDNGSMIVQNAGPNGSDGHEAWNWQSGNGNESSIDQRGNGARNTAIASQIGDDNQSKQKQTTSAGAGMTGNTGTVVQGHPGAHTIFDQLVGLSVWTDIIADVNGDANPIGVGFGTDLYANGAKAKQVQEGKENEADIFQFGGSVGASNYAEQHQDGAGSWGNDAGILQAYYGSGQSNYAKQYQKGEVNRAGLVQEGSAHKALQDQRGNYNEALSYQDGEGHLLNIHQRGNTNQAHSSQQGLANRALIVQKGGNSYVLEQNSDLGPGDLSAGGNQADILQLGPYGDFDYDAIECDFEDPMNLDMNYEVPGFDLDPICPDC